MTSKILKFLLLEAQQSITDFYTDWLWRYPKKLIKKFIANFKEFDRSLGLEAMVKNWFSPLYQDNNPWGLAIGVVIRTCYIIIAGGIFFSLYVVICAIILGLWYLLPFLMLFFFAKNFI